MEPPKMIGVNPNLKEEERPSVRVPSPFGNKIETFPLESNRIRSKRDALLRKIDAWMWFPDDPGEIVLDVSITTSASILIGSLMSAFPLIIGGPVIVALGIFVLGVKPLYADDLQGARVFTIRAVIIGFSMILGVLA